MQKGSRDPEFIYKYIQSLNKSNKSSIRIANLYLTKDKNLATQINQKIIFEATTEADSRIFDLLITHRKSIEKMMGKQVVAERIEKACAATAKKAIEFESLELQEEAKGKMKKHLSKKAERFALESDLAFSIATGDVKKYSKCCSDYVKKD